MKDTDDRYNKEIISSLQIIHCEINHTVPYIIMFYHNTQSNYTFDNNTLLYSYIWVYIWLLFIWTPWTLITGDPVYSILDRDSPFTIKFIVAVIVHFMIYFANMLGRYSNYCFNPHPTS